MSGKSSNWIAVITVAVLVPVLGIWVARTTVSNLDHRSQSAIGVDMQVVCVVDRTAGDAGTRRLCTRYQAAGALTVLSVATLVTGLALVFGFKGLGSWAGADRSRNAAVFPVAVPAALLVLAAVVVAQAAVAVLGLVSAGSGARLIVFIVIGAAVAVFALVGAIKTLGERPSHWEVAIEPRRDEATSVWELVTDVAKKVGARVPDHVILGLEPTFYATGADVNLWGERRTRRGQTLYLSLPFLRLLRREEVEAIVGHELGHFRGADTAYSLRFAPLYRGMSRAVETMEDQEQGFIQSLISLPAMVLCKFFLSVFALNERRISRDREFQADRVGARAASPQALGSGLIKLVLFGRLWQAVHSGHLQALRQGKARQNLSVVLAEAAAAVSPGQLSRGLRSALTERAVHPLETHPPTAERLSALSVDVADLDALPTGGWIEDDTVRVEFERLEIEATELENAVLRSNS